jgi:hypothetical protein
MPDNKHPDASRPRPKKKAKEAPRPALSRRRLALYAGAAAAGLVVIGLLIWGLVSLFTGGGGFGAVAAKTRPADTQLPIDALPAGQLPSASPGWKVAPDPLPLASGLTSAVPLPDGDVAAV